MKNPDVLIVGAGPTGLTAAAELSRLGVTVRIIDKNSGRTDKSKALGVQAGTLEVLQASFGEDFVQKMVSAGLPAKAVVAHFYDLEPERIDLSSIPSPFNFILLLAQSETERFLDEKLNTFGIKVERDTELLSLRQNDKEVKSVLRCKEAEEEELVSQFVIGADGAHSVVRHQLNIPFQGNSYGGEFILGDVDIEWPVEPGVIHTFINEVGALAAFPIDQQKRYRLILVPLRKYEGKSNDISLEEFTQIATSLCHLKITITKSYWLTRFSVHHRITKHFFEGRAFLAGDACHIHSPAGGQGMNTGIQDALNLSFKIHQVLKKNAPFALFREYEKERIPVAQHILRSTDLVTKVGMVPGNIFRKFARHHIAPLVIKNKWIQKKVVAGISQVNIAREEIRRNHP